MDIIEQLDQAYNCVCALSEGKITWRMSIPAQDNDPDMRIGDALLHAKQEIIRLRNVLECKHYGKCGLTASPKNCPYKEVSKMTEHQAINAIKVVLGEWETSNERDPVANEKAVQDIYHIITQITRKEQKGE
jgi:hypothetical protein